VSCLMDDDSCSNCSCCTSPCTYQDPHRSLATNGNCCNIGCCCCSNGIKNCSTSWRTDMSRCRARLAAFLANASLSLRVNVSLGGISTRVVAVKVVAPTAAVATADSWECVSSMWLSLCTILTDDHLDRTLT
jgi:hypothetical protein